MENVLGFVVLKFDVQTIFNSDLHLDRIVDVRGHTEGMDPEIPFLHDLGQPTRYGYTDKVSTR